MFADHDDEPGTLAGVDLHRWQVPPPPVGQRRAVLERALVAPVAAPPRRRRLVGMSIGFAIAAAIILLAFVALPARESRVVAPHPAGPPAAVEAEIRDLRRQIVQLTEEARRHQREIVERIAALRKMEVELAELRLLVNESTRRRTRAPAGRSAACDEVECVLTNYAGACCARLKRPSVDETGYLVAYTTPFAHVFIDGMDTGKSTPITPRSRIALSPGRHTLTFVLEDGRRYTYRVVIQAGETARFTKDLDP